MTDLFNSNEKLIEFSNYFAQHWNGSIDIIKFAFWPMCFVLLTELLLPGRRLTWKPLAFNIIYMPFFLAISGAVATPIIYYFNSKLPAGILNLRFHEGKILNNLIIFVIYVAIFDFLYYWFHRAQHHFPVLWQFHAVHHADTNVAMVSSVRHHWLEETLRYLTITAPMFLLFGGASIVPFWTLSFLGFYGLFLHWNTRFQFEQLGKFIVTPWFHRIHHSIEDEHINKNFAILLPLWDKLFGTAHIPLRGEFPETGIKGLLNPNSPATLLPWPIFKYQAEK